MAHLGSSRGGEFCSSIFDEDYSYFSGALDEDHPAEFPKLAYNIRRAFVVLGFLSPYKIG